MDCSQSDERQSEHRDANREQSEVLVGPCESQPHNGHHHPHGGLNSHACIRRRKKKVHSHNNMAGECVFRQQRSLLGGAS